MKRTRARVKTRARAKRKRVKRVLRKAKPIKRKVAKTRPRKKKSTKAIIRPAAVYIVTSSGLKSQSAHHVSRSATASEIVKSLGIKKKSVSRATSIVDDLKARGRIKKY